MNEALNHPHDKFTKEILSKKENARDFFLNYLPRHILAVIDLDSLEICKDSFIEKELREYFSDLLYRLEFSDGDKKKGRGYLYLLFEHKSSPEKMIAFHLLRYQVMIWGQYLKQHPTARKLPLIIPLVLYHGMEKWNIGIQFSDLISHPREELKAYVPDFSYLFYDLSAYSDDQIRGIIIVRVFLLLLKYIYHPDLASCLRQIFPLLKDLSQPGQGLAYLETIIRYIFNATDKISVDELKEIVDKNITKDQEDIIMTLAEQLVQQGVQQGLQQGVQQGLQQGLQQGEIKMAREAVIDVLEARFNEVPESLREKLAGIADRALLENLLRKAATIASAAELEKKIPVHNQP